MKVQHNSAQQTCCTFVLHFQFFFIKQNKNVKNLSKVINDEKIPVFY